MGRHALLPSIEALLAPETLSELTGLPIESAREQPLETQTSAYSGSSLSEVILDGVGQRLLLKRVSAAWDYFMRVTDDRHGREALVWTSGLLDRLPASLGHPYLACARDGDGAWAILMRDVAPTLLTKSG